MTRPVTLAAGVLLLMVGAFCAFNTYIQLRERGFTEAADIPIAVVGLVLGALALWSACECYDIVRFDRPERG